MKCTSVLLLLLVCTTVVHADTTTQKDFCLTISKIAQGTMLARQAGIPIIKMIKLANDNTYLESIVEDAYMQPLERSDESLLKNQRTEFGNSWYLKCNRNTNLRKELEAM